MEDVKNAAETLDAIREGGVQLIIAARDRLKEVGEALDEGRFTDAYERLTELQARLGPLAHAQANVATYQATFIVRAIDAEAGMVLKGLGEITQRDVETTPCVGQGHDHTIVTLHFTGDGDPIKYEGDAELLAIQD